MKAILLSLCLLFSGCAIAQTPEPPVPQKTFVPLFTGLTTDPTVELELIEADPDTNFKFCVLLGLTDDFILCYVKTGEKHEKLEDGSDHLIEIYKPEIVPQGPPKKI